MSDNQRLPPRLAAELARIFRRETAIPPQFDATVLLAARRAMQAARRWRRVRRWSAVFGGTAAAAILLAVFLHPPAGKFALGPPPAANARPDILSAYHLARALRLGETPPPQWDRNGDGKVDQNDVDMLAKLAVALGNSPGTADNYSPPPVLRGRAREGVFPTAFAVNLNHP